jgi:uncharacterized protein YdcH (DUF465 family)
MKRRNLESLSVPDLVDRFATIALEQDRALLYSEIAKFNRLFEKMNQVEAELKSRSGDQRRALKALYEHPNAQVRLKAAPATLGVMTKGARALIEEIANSRKFPQAGDAGMTLDALDRASSIRPDSVESLE